MDFLKALYTSIHAGEIRGERNKEQKQTFEISQGVSLIKQGR
jgi:hypothetical protein